MWGADQHVNRSLGTGEPLKIYATGAISMVSTVEIVETKTYYTVESSPSNVHGVQFTVPVLDRYLNGIRHSATVKSTCWPTSNLLLVRTLQGDNTKYAPHTRAPDTKQETCLY